MPDMPLPTMLAAGAPPIVPENAPFNAAQRAWLNGFFAGLMGLGGVAASPSMEAVVDPGAELDDAPWHDPAITLEERLGLAAERTLPAKLMASMGQLDCGQCGYDCKAYALAISQGAEEDLSLCQPGGSATQRMLKKLLAEAPAPAAAAGSPKTAKSGPSRANPALGKIKEAVPLNGEGSAKDTRAVVFDIAGTGLDYAVGDSLGVFPENCPNLVADILIELGGGDGTLLEQLVRERDVNKPSDEVLTLLAEAASNKAEAAFLTGLANGEGDLDTWDLLGLLRHCPSARPAAADVAGALAKLQPRLYSISSSPKAHPGEVHLTVGVVRFERDGRPCKGVASTYLAERAAADRPIRLYIQQAHGFRLPANPDTPVIMVGPGTGIAPFRAFLEERKATGAGGRNWLFFGDQKGDCDFLYREELAALQADGVLTRLDTAFSRDQAEKVYVQHRMVENAFELWSWLEEGACFYVCGDAKRMAKDVDDALVKVAEMAGGMDPGAAKTYVAELAKAGRYLRDVY